MVIVVFRGTVPPFKGLVIETVGKIVSCEGVGVGVKTGVGVGDGVGVGVDVGGGVRVGVGVIPLDIHTPTA